MQSTVSFSFLLGSLWSGAITLDGVLSMSQIELFDIKTATNSKCYIELFETEQFDHSTVCKYTTNV